MAVAVPRGKRWHEFQVGDEYTTFGRTVESGDVGLFAGLSGDYNPLHTDETFATKTQFSGRVAHGLLTLAISSGQQNQLGLFEGTTLAYLGMDDVRFPAPVRFGDTVRTVLIVTATRPSSTSGRGVVSFDVVVLNQANTVVLSYKQAILMAGAER